MRNRKITAAFLIIASVLLLSGCSRGNTIFQHMSLDDAAMNFYTAEDASGFTRSWIFQDNTVKEDFLKKLGAVTAKLSEQEDQRPSFPMYGFSLMDEDRFERFFAWSDGMLYAPDGKIWRFPFDFEKYSKDLSFSDSDRYEGLTGFPNARSLMLTENGWNTALLTPSGDLTGTGDVIFTLLENKDDVLICEFRNNSTEPYIFSNYFALQTKLGGIWYEIPSKDLLCFEDIAFELEAGASAEHTYNITPYGELPAGTYRITAGYDGREYAAEFELK